MEFRLANENVKVTGVATFSQLGSTPEPGDSRTDLVRSEFGNR